MHCGKTADQIRVSFGIIVRTGPGMRQVLAICPREGVLLGPHLRRAIVTDGDFTASVCDSASTLKLRFGVVCEVGRGIAVLDGVHAVQGEGEILGVLFPNVTMGNAVGSPTVKCF